MDDTGNYLIQTATAMEEGPAARGMRLGGVLLVAALPKVIRLLSIIGTIAMLLVGGGMFVHNIDALHHLLAVMPALLGELIAGLVVGGVLLGALHLAKMARSAVAE
jgi:predicted DNA repair protein MutK